MSQISPQAVFYAINAIDAALLLFVGVAEAKQGLEKRRSVLQILADEGRDPTPEEWSDLNSALADLRSNLHSA